MKRLFLPVTILLAILFAACTENPDSCFPGDSEDFVNLNGSWIRVESNNPSADGIVIKLVGNNGVIIDKSGSNFDVGDVKWRNIVPVDKENFMYEELGSDNNYYESNMELHADDTLRIMVGSSGAGNQQKWVRDGEYIPGQGGPFVTETLSDDIREERTLKNGPAEVDYLIDGVIDITADVVIEPGTVIEMKQNAGIGVYDGGSIKAEGTETEPVTITGASHLNGWWRGIHIETNSPNNILRNVIIEDAGSNYVYCCNTVATIFIKRGARVNLENVQLRNGKNIGILVQNDVAFDEYKNLRIETHKGYPLHIDPEVAGALDGEGSDYSGNDEDYVFMPADDITKQTTWNKLNVPYLIEGKVMDITERLIINAFVEIVFEEHGGMGVYDNGALSVYGNAPDPVTMRGKENLRGYWRGLHIETNSTGNSLNHLNLSNAGSNYVYCCNDKASILFKSGSALLSNCVISDGAGYGIVVREGFSFANFENNTITKHTLEPMKIPAGALGGLGDSPGSFTGNNEDYVLVADQTVTQALTIYAVDVPYKIEVNKVIDIVAPLTISPGVDLAFSENSGLGIYDNGALNAVGTTGKKIRFRGIVPQKGYWRGIHTETSNNIISYADIMHAGSNYVYCCNDKAGLLVKAGGITVEKTNIADNDGCGIIVRPGASLTESGNTYSNNTDGNVCN